MADKLQFFGTNLNPDTIGGAKAVLRNQDLINSEGQVKRKLDMFKQMYKLNDDDAEYQDYRDRLIFPEFAAEQDRQRERDVAEATRKDENMRQMAAEQRARDERADLENTRKIENMNAKQRAWEEEERKKREWIKMLQPAQTVPSPITGNPAMDAQMRQWQPPVQLPPHAPAQVIKHLIDAGMPTGGAIPDEELRDHQEKMQIEMMRQAEDRRKRDEVEQGKAVERTAKALERVKKMTQRTGKVTAARDAAKEAAQKAEDAVRVLWENEPQLPDIEYDAGQGPNKYAPDQDTSKIPDKEQRKIAEAYKKEHRAWESKKDSAEAAAKREKDKIPVAERNADIDSVINDVDPTGEPESVKQDMLDLLQLKAKYGKEGLAERARDVDNMIDALEAARPDVAEEVQTMIEKAKAGLDTTGSQPAAKTGGGSGPSWWDETVDAASRMKGDQSSSAPAARPKEQVQQEYSRQQKRVADVEARLQKYLAGKKAGQHGDDSTEQNLRKLYAEEMRRFKLLVDELG